MSCGPCCDRVFPFGALGFTSRLIGRVANEPIRQAGRVAGCRSEVRSRVARSRSFAQSVAAIIWRLIIVTWGVCGPIS